MDTTIAWPPDFAATPLGAANEGCVILAMAIRGG
jgi:hypothetical protein